MNLLGRDARLIFQAKKCFKVLLKRTVRGLSQGFYKAAESNYFRAMDCLDGSAQTSSQTISMSATFTSI